MQCIWVAQAQDGAELVVWQDVATVWASKVESLSLEAMRADQAAQAEAAAVFRIRYHPNLRAELRLVDDQSLVWNIESIAEIGRRDGIELRCSRVRD